MNLRDDSFLYTAEEETMPKRHFIDDLKACEELWNTLIPVYAVSDMWEFRMCFHRHFGHEPCFMVLEDSEGISGMLPLSYMNCEEMIGFFPGEIWKERTWLERTPFHVRDRGMLDDLLYPCPDGTYLRYMEVPPEPYSQLLELDEIGYVLYPSRLDFKLETYSRRFSNKKFKSIMKVIDSIRRPGSKFHINRLEDFETLVNMSIQNFGADSYLHDHRFRKSFRDVIHFLHNRGWLHMVSLEIMDKTVAVDIGALCNGIYTVYLGGTCPDLPGVAKVMNMYHIEHALRNRVLKVDFLCGDFHWKKLWHLDPEPLYKFVAPSLLKESQVDSLRRDDYQFIAETRIEDSSAINRKGLSASKNLS